MVRLFLAITTIAATVAATSIDVAPAIAQETFPTRPIKIINPLPVGAGADLLVRLVGEQLTELWRQPVIVESRPGGGGIIAAQAVAAAPPDGYTLLSGSASVYTILPAEKGKLPFDVNRDLIQVGMFSITAMNVAVASRLGIASLPEFIALARSRPHEIVVGTNGTGTLPHFAALALARMGNIPITVVPYAKGGTMAAIGDMLGGRVHATIEGMTGLRGNLQSGDLKLIAVMSPERDPLLPFGPVIGVKRRLQITVAHDPAAAVSPTLIARFTRATSSESASERWNADRYNSARLYGFVFFVSSAHPAPMKHVERAEDRGEQIVEVVGHTAGELTHGVELLRLAQRRLRLGEAGLVAHPVRDVVDKLVGADPAAVLVAQDVELHLVPAPVAAGIAELVDLGELLAGQGSAPDGLHGGGVLGAVGQELQHIVPRPRPLPKYAFELVGGRLVDRHPAVVEVRHLDKCVRALDDVGQELTLG